MFYLTFSVDTTKAEKKIKERSNLIYKYILAETNRQMERYAKELQRFIEEQSGDWAALSEQYLGYKIKKGLDPRVLIATGEYLKSIKVKMVGDTDALKTNPESTITSAPVPAIINKFMIYPEGHEELAEWLEFGTDKMPARPHWTHIAMEIKYNLKQILRIFASRKAQELAAKYK